MLKQFCYFFILSVLNFGIVYGEDDYMASVGLMSDCPEFKNEKIDVGGITYEMMEEDEQQGMKIGGKIVLNYDIDERTKFYVTITKEHEGDKEVVLGIGFKFCESLEDENAPHRPVLDALSITKCPVKAGEYKLEGNEISIKLDDFKEFLNENYVGQYILEVAFDTAPPEPDSCHGIEMSVYKV